MPAPTHPTVPRANPNIKLQDMIVMFAEKGDKSALERLLNRAEGNINAFNPLTGQSALHCVAEKGHVAAIQLLLRYKADIALQDRDGRTAKNLAEKSKQLNGAFEELSKAEAVAFPLITSQEWNELLFSADLKKFREGLKKFNCNYYVFDMIKAVYVEHNSEIAKAKAKILIEEYNFNINNRDKDCAGTMIHILLINEDFSQEIVLELVKLTANRSANEKLNPNIKNKNGQTILMLAIITDHKELVDFLLTRRMSLKLDINIQDTKGFTALHYACICRNIPAITSLMQMRGLQGDNKVPTPLQLLKDEYRHEIDHVMEKLLLRGDRDVGAKTDFLWLDHYLLVRKSEALAKDLTLEVPPPGSADNFSLLSRIEKQHGIFATKKNIMDCMKNSGDFAVLGFDNKRMFIIKLNDKYFKCLLVLKEQFAGISRKDHLFAKTKQAVQLFALSTATTVTAINKNALIINANTLTTVGTFKKATVAPTKEPKEAHQEQKNPN